MAFPDLQLRADPDAPGGYSALYAEATGIPVPGNNTFKIPFARNLPAPNGSGIPAGNVEFDWLEIDVLVPAGSDVTFADAVSLAPNKEDLTINFTTGGAGSCRVVCRLIHSIER
ncbi:MAG: hypothetical protein IT371_30650 [Deltaproteobacteria bacterium]|nr:hypothetical protein [Deltaproteobacteria bacterium]